MQKPKVFISYAKEDKERALTLNDELSKNKIEPWIDCINIYPGQNWENTIKAAIEKADYFIALLSTNSVDKKGFVQKELKRALEVYETFPEGKIFVIPARLELCEPSHHKLRELHWVDLFPSWEKGVKRLLLSINIDLGKYRPTKGGGDKSRSSTKRIETRIQQSTYKDLEELRDFYGTSSDAELIRQALRVYKYITEVQQKGDSVAVHRKTNEGNIESIKLTIPST